MLTEQEIKEIREEIKKINSEINELQCRERELKNKLTNNNIEIAQSCYPGINEGDKVEVTIKTWDFKTSSYENSKKETLYFKDVRPSHYGDKTDPNRMEVVFNQPKKDGSRGLREVYHHTSMIIKIEKVAE